MGCCFLKILLYISFHVTIVSTPSKASQKIILPFAIELDAAWLDCILFSNRPLHPPVQLYDLEYVASMQLLILYFEPDVPLVSMLLAAPCSWEPRGRLSEEREGRASVRNLVYVVRRITPHITYIVSESFYRLTLNLHHRRLVQAEAETEAEISSFSKPFVSWVEVSRSHVDFRRRPRLRLVRLRHLSLFLRQMLLLLLLL